MRWQGKSVLFEGLAFVLVKITFICGQCDTTIKLCGSAFAATVIWSMLANVECAGWRRKLLR